MGVLRHLYELPVVQESSDGNVSATYPWKDLCDAAEGFGIPSLRGHAMDRLEAVLTGLLNKGFNEDEIGIRHFVKEALTIHQSAEEGHTAAVELMAKQCCKHFAELRKHEVFNEVVEECPEFFRTILDYAAREGLLTSG